MSRALKFSVKEVEFFIEEVKKRPSIWNKEAPEFYLLQDKNKAWEELCFIFHSEGLTKKKGTTLNILQKLWRYLRLEFTRVLRKERQAPNSTKYPYFERLSFLEDLVGYKNSSANNPTTSMDEIFIEDDESPHIKETLTLNPNVSLPPLQNQPSNIQTINSLPSPTNSSSNIERCNDDAQFCSLLQAELIKIPYVHRLKLKLDILGRIQQEAIKHMISAHLSDYGPLPVNFGQAAPMMTVPQSAPMNPHNQNLPNTQPQ